MERPQQVATSYKMLNFAFIVFLLSISITKTNSSAGENTSTVKAMFVFGDSVLDVGNNNFINSTIVADYFPYGVDFPLGPTGRFTNGRNPADILGQLLGLPDFLPAFYDPQTEGQSILAGVNYASAGSGILDSTEKPSNVIPLSHQISNFQGATLVDLKSQLEGAGVQLSSYLSQAIFTFNTGFIDYLWNCFGGDGTTADCELQEFTELLIKNYTQQLKRVYDLGARKFVVLNCLPNGCNPYYKGLNNGSCFQAANEAAMLYNIRLKSALEGLSEEIPGFNFVYVNVYKIIESMLDDPAAYGLQVIDEPCCPVSSSFCIDGAEPCPDRTIYAFYDRWHPTEKAYMQICTKAYSSELVSEAYPFNVEVLANLITTNATMPLGSKPWCKV